MESWFRSACSERQPAPSPIVPRMRPKTEQLGQLRGGRARTCCTAPETLENESVLLRFRRSLRSTPLPAPGTPPVKLVLPQQVMLPQPPVLPQPLVLPLPLLARVGTRSGAASAAAAS